MIRAALAFAAQGWPVFAMTRSKHPAGGMGLKSASTDPEQVRLLFGTDGAEFVAIATGQASGIAALDIDPAARHWFDTRRRYLRVTWTQSTPRDGLHLLYRWPPSLRCSSSKLAKGVDIRGEGGSCIVAGLGYTMLDNRDPIEFPSWILNALAKIDNARDRATDRWATSGREASIEALEKFVAASREGERNGRLFWAACRAGSAAPGLLPSALACGLAAPDAKATIKSAMRRARR